MNSQGTQQTTPKSVADEAKSVLILRNPKSGSRDSSDRIQTIATQLTDSGFDVEMMTDVDRLVEQAHQLQAESKNRLRAVLAAGGDGTISLLANRLPVGSPLAICPLGTENLLAKHLGITNQPAEVVNTISNGKLAQLDVGKANGKLFLVTASCGFDADVVNRLHRNRSGHISHWSYAMPILSSIRQYRFPTIRITIDDQTELVEARWAFIFNVPRYAMNLPLARQADPTDGKLDLCTFRGGGLLRGIYYLFATSLGRHHQWTSSQAHQATTMRLEADSPVPFQIDGDPGGELPLTIETLPNYLNILVP